MTRPLARALCIVLLLQGCTGTSAYRELNRPGIKPATELETTPFYPQQAYQCGPAALATVMVQAGVNVSPELLRPQVYLPGRAGSLQADMLATPAAYGLLAVLIEPSLPALLSAVASGYPVLVLQNLGLASVPVWHYAVVIGYDLNNQQIYLRSGTKRRLGYSFERFARSWAYAGHWAFVVVPPDVVPVAVAPAAYLQAANVLERVQSHQLARQAYQSAAQHWPENALAWAGAGNSAYALGAFTAAEADYRRALELDQSNVLLMNNLAAVLGVQGCRAEALAVIECARAVESVAKPVLAETAEEARQSKRQRLDCRRFNCPARTP